MDLLLKESESARNSERMIDDQIHIAIEARDSLANQRAAFKAIQTKLNDISNRYKFAALLLCPVPLHVHATILDTHHFVFFLKVSNDQQFGAKDQPEKAERHRHSGSNNWPLFHVSAVVCFRINVLSTMYFYATLKKL